MGVQATIKMDTGRDSRNHPRVRLERDKPVPWAGSIVQDKKQDVIEKTANVQKAVASDCWKFVNL